MKETVTDYHVDRIRSDIIGHGLTYEPLIDDITDHICCMVEEEMRSGKSFELSYSGIIDIIGDNQLGKIQHDTLLLLDKKFQQMKKLTYFTGLSSTIIVLFGAISKHMHWPGAGIELSLGLLLIVLVFLPLYFIVTYREQTEKKSVVYPVTGYFTVALLLVAAVFRIQHWPGADTVVKIALAVLIIGFLPLYIVNAFQKIKKGKENLPYIIMILVGVAIVTLMFNVRYTKEAIDCYREEAILNRERIAETERRSYELLKKAGEEGSPALAQITDIHKDAIELRTMIDNMLKELLASINEPGASLENIRKTDHEGSGREVIVDSGWARKFITASREYKDMLMEAVDDPVVRNQIEDHLEFTGNIWHMEYGLNEVVNDPVIRLYFKHTDASKGIALSEYVAINYLMKE